ncbi:glycosyltransferase family 2 protein [Pseudonocardia kujensis]|uniref:glycosyltransferase family 2 protein n=1 Tax=Pseudonocardia kujensis TaxID=1128675 RepID=UPI001E62F9C6|nr:glycosyltransferase family 2 protein [Pseudonocardia kujensis]MCE0762130.1 glycosyltransferase family 2 protein [Pseudonocardia kujensis]
MQRSDRRGQRSADPTVSVVVPTRNEARNLQVVLPAIAAVRPAVHEVIVVDGNSVDGTVETARRVLPWVRIVEQTRKGKGNAMACGFAAATGDIIVMFDADGSADPAEIPAFVAALKAGADFAKGSRFTRGGGSDDITLLRRTGNAGLNGVANALFGTRHSDLCYGYNAFWADLLPLLELPAVDAPAPDDGSMLWGDGFEIETVLACRVAAAGLRVTEVPSYERERLFGDTNLRTFADGTRVLRTLAAERRRANQRREEPPAVTAPAAARYGTPLDGSAPNGYPATNGHTGPNGHAVHSGPGTGAPTNGFVNGGHVNGGHVNGGHVNGGHVNGGQVNGNGHVNGRALGNADTLPVPPTTEPVEPVEPVGTVAQPPAPPAATAPPRPSPRPGNRPAAGNDRPTPQRAAAQREALDARYALEEEAS